MSERRALLDPDMYKISEEDSQDEEVLSSMGNLNLVHNNNSNNNHGSELLMQKACVTTTTTPGHGLKLFANNSVVIQKPKRKSVPQSLPPSLSNGNKRKQLLEDKSRGRDLYDSLGVDWPNTSTSSSSSSSSDSETDHTTSDTESARSGSTNSETETNGSGHSSDTSTTFSSSSNSQEKERRNRGKVKIRARHGTHDDDSSSCSSCDRQGSNSGSESDVEEQTLIDGNSYHITEREILAWTNEDGDVCLVESYIPAPAQDTATVPPIPSSSFEKGNEQTPDEEEKEKKSSGSNSSHDNQTPSEFRKSKRSRNDLKNPEDQFLQKTKTKKESKGGKGRISRFLTRSRVDNGENCSEPSGSTSSTETKGKSRRIKMFRFKDEAGEGELRDVEMSLTSWDHRSNLGRRATLLESLLGIVPGRFSSSTTAAAFNSSRPTPTSDKKGLGTTSSQLEFEDNRIMVAGFIPGGPAIKNRHIKIGDWLRTVNGIAVNFASIDAVLSSLHEDASQKVNLGLERVGGVLINEHQTSEPRSSTSSKVSKEGPSMTMRSGVNSTPCLRTVIPNEYLSRVGLVYITNKDPNSSSAATSTTTPPSSSSFLKEETTKEVGFSWPLKSPGSEWKQIQTLVTSQGMFSTLYQLLRDVTGNHPTLSKVVGVDGDVIEVSYWSDNGGESLLLFAITVESQGRCLRDTSTLAIMEHLQSAITFRWGSLVRAFSEVREEEMDRFLSNTLAPLIGRNGYAFLRPPMALPISPTVQVVIGEKLFSFETSDFYSRKFPRRVERSSRRKRRKGRKVCVNQDVFHCLGSCLFYKEKLVISHLDCDTQVKFYGWMMSELNKWSGQSWDPMKRLILWQETFHGDGKSSCYSILVGVEHFILGFMLEPIGVGPLTKKRRPDVPWIQKALRTVGRLASRRDIVNRINHERKSVELLPWNWKNGPTPAGEPTPSHAKKKLKKDDTKEKKEMSTKGGKTHFPLPGTGFSPKLKKSGKQVNKAKGSLALLSEEYNSNVSNKDQTEGFDELDESTTGTESDAGSLKWSGDRSLIGDEDKLPEAPAKPISIMKGDILFHFVHMEFGSGVMLSSFGLDEGPYPELFHHFRTTADVTHQILQRAANARKRLRDQDNDKKWVSRTLAPICEHGTLFECQVTDPKGGLLKTRTKIVNYWVVGRLYSDQRATFLCYQDTEIPQNHIECAFRLAHYI